MCQIYVELEQMLTYMVKIHDIKFYGNEEEFQWAQKYFLLYMTVSVGYSHNGLCACTALYYLSILLLPCLKDVNRSNLAHTAFVVCRSL